MLPPEKWGAWARASGECVRSIPGVFGLTDTSHPAEPPYFYHCVRCVTSILEKSPPPKPWLRRDQGLCIRCGEPAAPVNVIRIPAAACALAEELGITLARLNTKKFCSRCNPFDKSWCRGGPARAVKRGDASSLPVAAVSPRAAGVDIARGVARAGKNRSQPSETRLLWSASLSDLAGKKPEFPRRCGSKRKGYLLRRSLRRWT